MDRRRRLHLGRGVVFIRVMEKAPQANRQSIGTSDTLNGRCLISCIVSEEEFHTSMSEISYTLLVFISLSATNKSGVG